MYEARPYQTECLEALQGAVASGKKNGLVVMAPGLGKTITAALHVQQWLSAHGGRVLYLCHQTDIIDQSKDKFQSVLGDSFTYGLFHGKDKNLHSVDMLFASFQTMEDCLELFERDEFGYVIVDESHHTHAKTYLKTVRHFTPKFLLGLTATPDRHDGLNIREVYGEALYNLALENALARGLLAPVDYRIISEEIRIKDATKTIASLSVKDLNQRLFVPKLDAEIGKMILRYAEGIRDPRILIFCNSIKHCDELTTFIEGSTTIHSRIPSKERVLRLELFRQGIVSIALTVDALNEGVDIPEANMLVFLRSTASSTIFFQQLGRGLRKAEGKEKVLVLDFVANCERVEMVHDLWKGVKEKRAERHIERNRERGVSEPKEPVDFDIGGLNFDEVAKNVISMIKTIREVRKKTVRHYSNEELIAQLQGLAKQLGRSPSSTDLVFAASKGTFAGPGTFSSRFGGHNGALRAAGLAVRERPGRFSFTREQLVQQLKAISEDLEDRKGKTAYHVIITLARQGKCAFPGPFIKLFGSVNAALREAGFSVLSQPHYSKEELLSQLRQLSKKLGKPLSFYDIADAKKRKECASPYTFQSRFGTVNEAIRSAGLVPFKRPPNRFSKEAWRVNHAPSLLPAVKSVSSRERCIRELLEIALKLGRNPAARDVLGVEQGRGLRLMSDLITCFGSFRKALEVTGLTERSESSRVMESQAVVTA